MRTKQSSNPKKRKQRTQQSPLLFDERELLSPPYAKASVSIAATTSLPNELDSGRVKWLLKLASYVDVLLVWDDWSDSASPDSGGQAQTVAILTDIIDRAGGAGKVEIQLVRNGFDYEQYFLATIDIALVLTDSRQFSQFYNWNERRKKIGGHGYDILCYAGGSNHRYGDAPPMRAFALASIGGTFNALHEGHREYLKSALRLADMVHILISDDEYARPRKTYTPLDLKERRDHLTKYLRYIGCSDRAVTQRLIKVTDIEKYVTTSVPLDLVITEHTYFDWFDEWNRCRNKNGLAPYGILCRERTVVHGSDLSSSMFAEIESSASRKLYGIQDDLFD
jgi:cytidyltransferase-like protein